MEGLNKKLSAVLRQILEKIDNQGLLPLSLTVITLSAVNQIINLGPVTATIIYTAAFSVLVAIQEKYRYTLLFAAAAVALYVLEPLQSSALTTLFLGLAALTKILEKFSSFKTALLILSNLAHLGDALTTYIGLEKGLSEQNPVVLPLTEASELSIFLVKAVVLPVTVYIYLTMGENESQALLKIIFFLGLFLTASNMVSIL